MAITDEPAGGATYSPVQGNKRTMIVATAQPKLFKPAQAKSANINAAVWPCFTQEEADAVANVLLSNRVNYHTGTQTREFEQEFASWTGAAHGIALANGTLALDAALRASGIGEGDEVIVSPRSFIASVSCVVNAGARPVFADVERDSGNISPQTIADVITEETRAIIPVHLGGWPCDMEGILALAEAHKLAVIEDCAQAHGARINGRSVGTFGNFGAWSFCQDKIMTTGGEGGMLTCGDSDLFEQAWSMKDHGKSRAVMAAQGHPPGFRYVHESFGTNWRMTEMQGAIGRIQLERLNEWSAQRARNAMILAQTLRVHSDIVRLPMPGPRARHAFYRLYAYARPSQLGAGWSRDRLIAEMALVGVPVMHGSCPEIYREKAFDGTSFRPESPLPIARELGETSIAFLVHPTIDEDDAKRIASKVHKVLQSVPRA